MKKASKFLSLMLAICIALSAFTISGAALEFPDVATTASYYPAVSLLSSLGIIKGYEDGTFGPDRDVTRAEFSVMLMRAMALSGVASNDMNGMPFSDVEGVVSWAGGDIKTAYTMGIINGMGDGTFAPDEKVTYEQALKMVVCALGYYPVALQAVGGDESKIWPNGYINVATQLKLNAGIGGAGENSAKRWDIAKIIYNALEVELLEEIKSNTGDLGYRKNDKTLLKDYLNVYYSTGEILADEKTTIYSTRTARPGEALIYDNEKRENLTVYTGDVSTDGLVGLSVKYYYKEDANGDRTIVHLEKKTNADSILTLTSDMIDSVSGTIKNGFTFNYWENSSDRNTTKVSTSENPLVSINGRAVTSTTADDLFPESGEVVLIDSNNDGNYNKINVTSYATYVVSSVNTSEYIISDLYRTASQGKTYKADLNDSQIVVNIKDSDGNTISFGSISKWNVVSIKESMSETSKSIIDIVVSKKSISGSITSFYSDEDIIEIGGTQYEVSNYFKTYASSIYESLNVGDSGKFYLDKDGKIAAFDKSVSTGDTIKYGYLVRARVNTTKEVAEFFLVTNTVGSSAVRCQAASKVKIDGEIMSDADQIVDTLYGVVDTFKAPSSTTPGQYMNVDNGDIKDLCPQLVKYSLNSSGEVNMIDTAAEGGDLVLYEKNSTADWKYGSAAFKDSKNNTQIKVDSNTYIVFAPDSDRSAGDEYIVKKYSSSLFKSSTSYNIEAYDVDGAANNAKALVVYGGNITNNINSETGMLIVTNVSRSNNSEGFEAYKVTGYLCSIYEKGTEKTYFTENAELPEGIEVGNVVRFGTTSKGYINSEQVQVVVDVTADEIEPFTTNCDFKPIAPVFISKSNAKYSSTNDTYVFRMAHGLLYMGIEDDTGSYGYLAPTGTRTKDAVDAVEDNVWMFTLNSNAKFYTYDASQTNNYKVTAHDGLMPLSGYSCYKDTADGGSDESAELAQEIFVYEGNGQIRMVYIIKR